MQQQIQKQPVSGSSSRRLKGGSHTAAILLVILCIFPYPALLSAGEKRAAGQEQKYRTIPLSPYLEGPDYLVLIAADNDSDRFDLSRYYDALEPPDQDGLLGRYTVLAEDTMYFLLPAMAAMGAIYLLPEDVSHWDKENVTIANGLDEWPENSTSWVWDKDNPWINYVGHPYFGSSYYIYARHYGYSRLESFCYSFVISSFYEIGIEAWAEPVSIQDMIFTPLLGAGLGELLLPLEHLIRENNNRVLNSRIQGGISLFLIDPFGHIVLPLKRWTKEYFATDADVRLAPTFEQYRLVDDETGTVSTEQRYGLRLTVRW